MVWDETQERKNVSAQRLRKSLVRDLLVEAPALAWLRRTLIPRSWRERVKRFWQMKSKVEIHRDHVRRLEVIFDDDLARLGRWLGMGLTCSTFKSAAINEIPTWSDVDVTTASHASLAT